MAFNAQSKHTKHGQPQLGSLAPPFRMPTPHEGTPSFEVASPVPRVRVFNANPLETPGDGAPFRMTSARDTPGQKKRSAHTFNISSPMVAPREPIDTSKMHFAQPTRASLGHAKIQPRKQSILPSRGVVNSPMMFPAFGGLAEPLPQMWPPSPTPGTPDGIFSRRKSHQHTIVRVDSQDSTQLITTKAYHSPSTGLKHFSEEIRPINRGMILKDSVSTRVAPGEIETVHQGGLPQFKGNRF